jgi:hypothetical protein
MNRIAVLLTLAASTTLWSVSAYSMAPTPSRLGEVMAQTQTITQEKTIIRETIPPPPPGVTVLTVRQAPPAARQDAPSPPPSPKHVLVPGYWTWGNNEWVWVYGRWETPPDRTVTWIPGQWIAQGEEWTWRAGRWE